MNHHYPCWHEMCPFHVSLMSEWIVSKHPTQTSFQNSIVLMKTKWKSKQNVITKAYIGQEKMTRLKMHLIGNRTYNIKRWIQIQMKECLEHQVSKSDWAWQERSLVAGLSSQNFHHKYKQSNMRCIDLVQWKAKRNSFGGEDHGWHICSSIQSFSV